MRHRPTNGMLEFRDRAVTRLRTQYLGGGSRTLVGVLLLMFLSMAAMVVIAVSANRAAGLNAATTLYDHAAIELQTIWRGLNEATLTGADSKALAAFQSARKEFQEHRHGNDQLHEDTVRWPELDRGIDELLRDRRGAAFEPESLATLGVIATAVEEMVMGMERQEDAYREKSAQAEQRVQVVNIAAGVLMMLATACIFIMRDITARRAMDGLRASESQLRDITDAQPAMVAYVDAGRRFRFHNKACEQVLGFRPGQINGLTLREVFDDETHEALRVRMDEVLAGFPAQFEHVLKNAPDGPRDYAFHLLPRHREDRADRPVIGFYFLARDVTEEKRIDRMKSEFVSTVSHELRTPLTSICGSLGLLAGGVAGMLPVAAKGLVDIAKRNGERLIRLINDILDTEKIESGLMRMDLKVVDLQVLVAQTLAANEGLSAQHQVSLALRAPQGALRAHVDPDRFVQVVTNLLSNAIKFSPPQGTVEVTLSLDAGRVRIEVQDSGPGIPEVFRGRIFQKFSQADSSDSRQKGGTGLGLNISKAIVERLGGTIGLAARTDACTTFFFELPEWQDAPAVVTADAAGEPNRRRILVCEHDADVGRLIGMMLDGAGYQVDLACTAAQARELVAEKPYAAMTVALKLPNQDGAALIRALREEAPTRDLPIVAVSACAERGRIRINSETFSVADWLGKPIHDNRLLLAIRRAIDVDIRKPPMGTETAKEA